MGDQTMAGVTIEVVEPPGDMTLEPGQVIHLISYLGVSAIVISDTADRAFTGSVVEYASGQNVERHVTIRDASTNDEVAILVGTVPEGAPPLLDGNIISPSGSHPAATDETTP